MAVNKPRVNVTTSFKAIITTLSFFGMMPFSMLSYYRHKILKTSILGNIYLIVNIVHFSIEYHLETVSNSERGNKDSGKLTILISAVIIYMEPTLMVSDGLTFFFNQKRIINLLSRMDKVNEKLIKENINVNLGKVQRISIIFIASITLLEIGVVTYNYVVFNDAIWFIPIYLGTMGKVFYVLLVYTSKEFFNGINHHLESTKMFFDEKKSIQKQRSERVVEANEFGYLHKEILINRTMAAKRKDLPSSDGQSRIVNVIPHGENEKKLLSDEKPFSIDSNELWMADKMDKKIKQLCRVHDDICDIAGQINRMFSIQMLILIAYSFMAITARIYFMYCSLVGQTIPVVFRAAESTMASSIYLVYTAAKCLVVVAVSYDTKQVAQRTGIYLHKVATAVDDDRLYETINHLSLKLLNHSIRFSACGFFELDMSTLYAITGAITSYIIILIQFNLAALRVRKPIEMAPLSMNETAIEN